MRCIICICIMTIIVFGCSGNHTKYLTSKTWEYDKGYKVGLGDYITFNGTSFSLKHDTIFFNGSPAGIITRVHEFNDEIFVKSMDGKESGAYFKCRWK